MLRLMKRDVAANLIPEGDASAPTGLEQIACCQDVFRGDDFRSGILAVAPEASPARVHLCRGRDVAPARFLSDSRGYLVRHDGLGLCVIEHTDAARCAAGGERIHLRPFTFRLANGGPRDLHPGLGVAALGAGLAPLLFPLPSAVETVLDGLQWLIVALFGGGGILAYIIAWIAMPRELVLISHRSNLTS